MKPATNADALKAGRDLLDPQSAARVKDDDRKAETTSDEFVESTLKQLAARRCLSFGQSLHFDTTEVTLFEDGTAFVYTKIEMLSKVSHNRQARVFIVSFSLENVSSAKLETVGSAKPVLLIEAVEADRLASVGRFDGHKYRTSESKHVATTGKIHGFRFVIPDLSALAQKPYTPAKGHVRLEGRTGVVSANTVRTLSFSAVFHIRVLEGFLRARPRCCQAATSSQGQAGPAPDDRRRGRH